MAQKPLSEAEMNMLGVLLREYRSELADMTCDEFEIQDTPENREMDKHAFLSHDDDVEVDDYEPCVDGKTITIGGSLMVRYLLIRLGFDPDEEG